MTDRCALAWAPILLAGTVACQPAGADRMAGSREVQVTQGTEGVIQVEIRLTERRPVPDLAAFEARCRQELSAAGQAEAAERRMPPPYLMPESLLRSEATRDPATGTTVCIASTPVFPAGGRPWGR